MSEVSSTLSEDVDNYKARTERRHRHACGNLQHLDEEMQEGKLKRKEKTQATIVEAPLGKQHNGSRHMMLNKWQRLHDIMMMKYNQQMEEMLEVLAKNPRCQARLIWRSETRTGESLHNPQVNKRHKNSSWRMNNALVKT